MAEMQKNEEADQRQCLICGTSEDPTVEHIVPQTLWNRFGLDPDHDDLARFRTDLCSTHNQATSVLHGRTEMMDLIVKGAPVTRKTLQHLGDWAVWVTLLLSLARGAGVLGDDASREMLSRRFDTDFAGTPKGVRVYAAVVDDSAKPRNVQIKPFVLALQGDSRVLLNDGGLPVGFSVKAGPIHASETIRLGRVALLVVGRSYKSGDDHEVRLDAAAAQVGLERILPLGESLPSMKPTQVSMEEISQLFTVIPVGADLSLMPELLRDLHSREDFSASNDSL